MVASSSSVSLKYSFTSPVASTLSPIATFDVGPVKTWMPANVVAAGSCTQTPLAQMPMTTAPLIVTVVPTGTVPIWTSMIVPSIGGDTPHTVSALGSVGQK